VDELAGTLADLQSSVSSSVSPVELDCTGALETLYEEDAGMSGIIGSKILWHQSKAVLCKIINAQFRHSYIQQPGLT